MKANIGFTLGCQAIADAPSLGYGTGAVSARAAWRPMIFSAALASSGAGSRK